MKEYLYNNINIISVEGRNCIEYLQGRITNDIKNLSSESPLQLNAVCNEKGRVLVLCFTFFISETEILLAIPKGISDKIIDELKRYSIFSKVNIFKNEKYCLIKSNQKESLFEHMIVTRKLLDKRKIDILEIYKSNIKRKLPIIDESNIGIFTPSDLELERFNAISYKKGCFMGQEIIARMKYIGKKTKKLLSIKCKKFVTSEQEILDSKFISIGSIINSISDDHSTYALIILKKGCSLFKDRKSIFFIKDIGERKIISYY